MARIDKFIDALFQFGADELRIVAGMRAILVTGKDAKPVTNQEASASQVEELLQEIAPADQQEALGRDGSLTFEHNSRKGRVTVIVGRVGKDISAALRPAPAVEQDEGDALDALRAWAQEDGEAAEKAPETRAEPEPEPELELEPELEPKSEPAAVATTPSPRRHPRREPQFAHPGATLRLRDARADHQS